MGGRNLKFAIMVVCGTALGGIVALTFFRKPTHLPPPGEPIALEAPEVHQARALYEQAEASFREKNWQLAESDYKKLIAEHPGVAGDDELDSFDELAKNRLEEVDCLKSRPSLPGARDPEALGQELVKALGQGDAAQLLQWADCSFQLGISESDVGFGINPLAGVPRILSRLRPLRWKLDLSQGQEAAALASEGSQPQVQLLLAKREGGWKWVGLGVSDSQEFDRWADTLRGR